MVDIFDIIGNRYGKLLVLRYSKKVNRHHKYICKCDCGNTVEVFRDNLLSGHKVSCANCCRIEKEGNYYRYFCSDGDSFIFDEIDLPLVSAHRWYITSKGYPKTNINRSTKILSRLVTRCNRNQYVDHINRDTRDNRRCNLRIAAPHENSRNGKVRKNNKCGYKGVSLHKGGKYRADIGVDGKIIYLGLFENIIDAAMAYDEAARKYHAEFARLNFPDSTENGCRV